MDFWDLTKLVFRRWYVFVPLLFGSVLLVLIAGVSVKPDYSASGHVQMIPPAETTSAARDAGRVSNPWSDLGFSALGTAVNLKVTQDENLLKDLVATGLTDSFTIVMEWNVSFFEIEAVGATPEQATATVQRLMKIVADEVAAQQLQFRVAPPDMITTLALDRGDKVTVVTSKRTRVLVVVAGVGLMISVAGTIAVDAFVRRRQRRREFDASEEMLGAKVPQGDGRQPRWSRPHRSTDPPRTASTARIIPEPERSAEIVPVAQSTWDRSIDAEDDDDPVLADQTLILPLAGPTRPAQKQPK